MSDPPPPSPRHPPNDHPDATCGTVTGLLRSARDGNSSAMDDLFRLVAEDLRRRAGPLVARSGQSDLNVTMLINGAVERLLSRGPIDAEDRRHFYFVLERAMHDVMVDHVRRGGRLCRGGGVSHREIDESDAMLDADGGDAIDLSEAVAALRLHDPDSAAALLLRHWGERTIDEIAAIMGATPSQVRGHIDYGYSFLAAHLAGERPIDGARRRATRRSGKSAPPPDQAAAGPGSGASEG